MSAGVAAVTSPAGSAVEFVRDGENAYFAASTEEWSERIRALAASPQERAEMGRRARATVEKGYSVRVWGPRFAACLEDAASGAHVRALVEERKP
jgi:glycosyltransferase involved in cell wall biosynthesis